ncbi:hypothetical protein [Aliiroseovarius sp. YM-037]|uniref:hypothetical protein n=1 Tax=Aliiroseovarius sp. YM-037 TaxID=3341728 RepID=UPI003A7F8D31
MKKFVLIGLLCVTMPSHGVAEPFAIAWLENCMEAANSDARPRLAASYCSQNVYNVCEHANSPQACAEAVVQVMNDETTRLLASIPSEFGTNEIERDLFAERYKSAMTGEGLPLCAQEDGSYPGCDAATAAWKYQFARGLAVQTGVE